MTRILIDRNVAVPMRDGIVHRAGVSRQDGDVLAPVILCRMPYSKDDLSMHVEGSHPARAVEAGCAEAAGERQVLQMVGPRWRLVPFGGREYEDPRTSLVFVGASDSETNDIVIELANHLIRTGEDPK